MQPKDKSKRPNIKKNSKKLEVSRLKNALRRNTPSEGVAGLRNVTRFLVQRYQIVFSRAFASEYLFRTSAGTVHVISLLLFVGLVRVELPSRFFTDASQNRENLIWDVPANYIHLLDDTDETCIYIDCNM